MLKLLGKPSFAYNKNDPYTHIQNTTHTKILSKSYKFSEHITNVLDRLECNKKKQVKHQYSESKFYKIHEMNFLCTIKSTGKCIEDTLF